jgi:hypothetical protein
VRSFVYVVGLADCVFRSNIIGRDDPSLYTDVSLTRDAANFVPKPSYHVRCVLYLCALLKLTYLTSCISCLFVMFPYDNSLFLVVRVFPKCRYVLVSPIFRQPLFSVKLCSQNFCDVVYARYVVRHGFVEF